LIEKSIILPDIFWIKVNPDQIIVKLGPDHIHPCHVSLYTYIQMVWAKTITATCQTLYGPSKFKDSMAFR